MRICYYLKDTDLIRPGDEYLCVCGMCKRTGRQIWLSCLPSSYGSIKQDCFTQTVRRFVKSTPKGNTI